MSYLIYGEDTYRSHQKLETIKQKYIDSNLGDTNLAQIDGSTQKADEVIRQLWISPFLAPKRLVIIHNLLGQGSKEIQQKVQEFLPKIPKTTLAIFYETGKVDKRNALFKYLDKPKFSQEFNLLDPIKLRQWTQRELSSKGVKLSGQNFDFLINNIGPDLWRMANEIQKIACLGEEISPQDIKDLVTVKHQGDIFALVDALSTRNLKSAATHLKSRLASGDAPVYIFSMFVYAFRTLLVVKDAINRDPSVRSVPDMKPRVFQKASQQCKAFNWDKLKAIYAKLRDLDYDIKLGIIEPEVALDLFLFELCIGKLRE